MPSKKRALAETDANAQPAPKKNQKESSKSKENEQTDSEKSHDAEHQRKHDEIESKQPHDWICIAKPYWCRQVGDDEDEEDDDDEDEQHGAGEESKSLFPQPASEHPTYKWVMLWQTWTMLTDWITRAQHTDPDNFGMYIYNDFHWYGLAELLESLLAEFEKAKNKHAKAKDHASLLDMWAPMATLAHWIHSGDADSFKMMDDGERTCRLFGLVGCAFVTMLSTLDKEHQLKHDSDIKDLGLVISLYVKWATGQEDYGIDDEDLVWRELLTAYAKKAEIDLAATGCDGISQILEDADADASPKALKGVDKRFNWTKTVKEYKQQHCGGKKLGGEHHNIMKMSRKERAEYAFDKKDPLADFSEADIKSGKLALG